MKSSNLLLILFVAAIIAAGTTLTAKGKRKPAQDCADCNTPPTECGDVSLAIPDESNGTTFPPNEWPGSLSYTVPIAARTYYEVAGQPGVYFMEVAYESGSMFRGNHGFVKIISDANGKPLQYVNLYVKQKHLPGFTSVEQTICALNAECKKLQNQKATFESIPEKITAIKQKVLPLTFNLLRLRLIEIADSMANSPTLIPGDTADTNRAEILQNLSAVKDTDVTDPTNLISFFESIFKAPFARSCPTCAEDSLKNFWPIMEKVKAPHTPESEALTKSMLSQKEVYMALHNELNRIIEPATDRAILNACLAIAPNDSDTEYCKIRTAYAQKLSCLYPRPDELTSSIDSTSMGGIFKPVAEIPGYTRKK